MVPPVDLKRWMDTELTKLVKCQFALSDRSKYMDGWTGNVFMEVEDELSALQIHSIPLLIGHIT